MFINRLDELENVVAILSGKSDNSTWMHNRQTAHLATQGEFQGCIHLWRIHQTAQESPISGIPRFVFFVLEQLLVLLLEVVLEFFIVGEILGVFAHDGMNHRHLQGGYFLHSRFGLTDVGGEVVIDE